ncbi:phosphatase PAP2 family protein [Lactobacillus panisapium]|uniref:phosphatase PAP2 family protein n=1 Tax=Lactobacillus panisapium TaxID=2012495 RepID=UPI0022E2DBB9|nr:phosphatase PAP2 family protein [Lactobacillus panisapium]
MLKKTRGERYLNTTDHSRKDTIIPATIFLLIYAAWAILVSSGNQFIHQFDKSLIGLICNNNPAIIKFATTFTNLGNTSVIMVATIILVIVLGVFRKYAFAVFTAGTMIAANGYNWIIKHAIGRQRPMVHHLVEAHGYSFPSGHSVGSATLFGILIILTILLVKKKGLKTILCIIWLCFPILIGYTRIFDHVHYPSDVVGGFLEGISFLLIGYSFLYHYYLDK